MMIHKKNWICAGILFLSTFFFVSFFSLCGCINFDQTDNSFEFLRKYENFPAERIIALSPSDCEVLYEIGAGDKIIGRSDNCDYPEDVKNIKNYGYGQVLNLEEIILAQPDIIIADKGTLNQNQIVQLKSKNIEVLENSYNSFSAIYEYINKLGIVSGNLENANILIEKIKSKYDEIYNLSHNKNLEGDKVYVEVSPLNYGLWTTGTNTFIDEVLDCLNLENVFYDMNSWGQVSQEQVISRNPDFIFSLHSLGMSSDNVNEILNRAGWQSINAVKNKQVYCLDNNKFNRPGPRLIDAMDDIYSIIYEK